MIHATKRLEPHPAGLELGRHQVEEGGVGGGIRVAEIVDRVDDASAEQVEPDPIGQVSAELRVLPRQPVRQMLEARFRCRRRLDRRPCR